MSANKVPDLEEMVSMGAIGMTKKKASRLCRIGQRGVSGFWVRLERWRTENGWVTSEAALRRYRENLNDPEYRPPESESCGGSGASSEDPPESE